jgi:hypothetical protein
MKELYCLSNLRIPALNSPKYMQSHKFKVCYSLFLGEEKYEGYFGILLWRKWYISRLLNKW